MPLFLELNDSALTLADGHGDVRYQAPACAAVRDGELVFGDLAQTTARSHPQQFNHRYLSALNAQPLAGAMGPARNHADLLYHHLAALPGIDQPLVVLVSNHLTNEQLGLILGICNELGYRVAGFLDLALTHGFATALPSDAQVLDLELHRLVATDTRTANEDRWSADSAVWEGRGVAQVIDGWMGMIATDFVERTRFDPLHAGDSEQQIYDQIRGWLGAPNPGPLRVVAGEGSAALNLDVSITDLSAKLEQRLSGVFDRLNGPVAVTHRVQELHTLAEVLTRQGLELIQLPGDKQIFENAAELARDLPTDRTARITRTRVSAASAPPPETRTEHTATHLLLDNIARPLHTLGADPSTTAGRRVELNGQTYLAIRVEDDGA